MLDILILRVGLIDNKAVNIALASISKKSLSHGKRLASFGAMALNWILL
jgi:hypothetical protein